MVIEPCIVTRLILCMLENNASLCLFPEKPRELSYHVHSKIRKVRSRPISRGCKTKCQSFRVQNYFSSVCSKWGLYLIPTTCSKSLSNALERNLWKLKLLPWAMWAYRPSQRNLICDCELWGIQSAHTDGSIWAGFQPAPFIHLLLLTLIRMYSTIIFRNILLTNQEDFQNIHSYRDESISESQVIGFQNRATELSNQTNLHRKTKI